MADQEQPQEERRSGDDRRKDSAFVSHVEAADKGISLGWRWAQILTTIIGAAFLAGITYSGFSGMREELRDLRTDVAKIRDSQISSDKQGALDRRDIDQLQKDVTEMKADLKQMRDIREAMIYSSANAVLRKQQSLQTPP